MPGQFIIRHEARPTLGGMYGKGQGVVQDDKEAVRWYRLAADQGDAIAQSKLGLRYKYGVGVPQNLIEAHKWFNLSGSNGEEGAAALRDDVASKMTEDQIAEAQALARDWKPKEPAGR